MLAKPAMHSTIHVCLFVAAQNGGIFFLFAARKLSSQLNVFFL